MSGDLLFLNDRIEPGGANDQDEVIKVASALDEIEGRPAVRRVPGRFDQHAVIDRARRYQQSRGLVPDGLINPKGATAQRIAAEQMSRRRISGPPRRGANLPLWGSVGAGGINLPGDRQAMTNALTLTGHLGNGAAGKKEDAVTGAVRAFQKSHGLRIDGLAEPYGPTHDMLDHVLGPRLDWLVGADPAQPMPFSRPEPQIVGRRVPGRSTTIRTRFQDDEDLDNENEYRAALDLNRAMADYDADLRLGDAAGGGAGDDTLIGEAGDDRIASDGEPDVDEAPLYHNNVGDAVDRLMSLLQTRRFAGLDDDPDLQARTIESRRNYYADKSTRAIETGLRGVMQQARRLADPHTPRSGDDPHKRLLYPRLVVAHMEVLAERYRAENPGLSDNDVNRMVLEKAAVGMGLSNEQAELLLSFTPYTGPLFFALDGMDLFNNVKDAIETGDYDIPTIGMALAAMVPGVPGVGKKAGKKGKGDGGGDTGGKADRSSEVQGNSGPDKSRENSADDSRRTDEDLASTNPDVVQRARRKRVDWRENWLKKLRTSSIDELIDERYWSQLSNRRRKTLRSAYASLKRRESEAEFYVTGRDAGVIEPGSRDILKRSRLTDLEGKQRTRHGDAFEHGRIEENKKTGEFDIVDADKTWLSEAKFAGAQKSTNQRRFDSALERGIVVHLLPSKSGAKYYPAKLEPEVLNYRIPMGDLDEEGLISELRKMLSSNKVPDEYVDTAESRLRAVLREDLEDRNDGGPGVATLLPIGILIGAVALPDTEDGQ
ncbi:MAG: hypothetical protein ACMVY4_10185 [Minwuia sp.]|uniref:hypothetical protein n=1 Tax=Minwuia sp. TaxID=2493630 RepID=UPI003A854D49